jgi:Kef-type K+ transport system membrane component KefB
LQIPQAHTANRFIEKGFSCFFCFIIAIQYLTQPPKRSFHMSNLHLFVDVITAVIVILIVTQVFGTLITYIGQPKVVGEMISGVLLGPTCFGYFFPGLSVTLFGAHVMPVLFILSNLGLSIYMFLVGAEMDLKLFDKKSMKQSGLLSAAAVITPFILGFIAGGMYSGIFAMPGITIISFSIFLGTALAITAFPMMARILQEKNVLKTKIGSIIMLSASIQDVISWILLAFVTAMAQKKGISSGVITLVGAFVFITLIIFLIKPLMQKIGNHTERKGKMSSFGFSVVIVLLLICALTTDHLGLYSVFGGFILGLAMPRGTVFQAELHSKLKDVTVVLLLPLFFTYSGLNANMLVLANMTYLAPSVVIIIFAFVSKYVSALLAMRASGFTWREASAMGGLTNARGLMELIVANIGLMYFVINKELYSILILVAILTTLAAMPIYNLSMKNAPKNKDPM